MGGTIVVAIRGAAGLSAEHLERSKARLVVYGSIWVYPNDFLRDGHQSAFAARDPIHIALCTLRIKPNMFMFMLE